MSLFKWLPLLLTVVALQSAYADFDEAHKDVELARVFSELHGVSTPAHKLECHFVAPLLNAKYESLSIYSCFPSSSESHQPTPLSRHFQSDAYLIEYNEETGVAQPKTVKIQDAAFVAFGNISEPMEKTVYKPSFTDALIVPIKDSKLAAKIAQFLYMKNRSADTSNLQLFAQRVDSNQGHNLPWLNWEFKNLSEVSSIKADTKIEPPLVALLDSEGRIITGHFPTGDLILPKGSAPAEDWQIKTQPQALWSAKFASNKDVTESPSGFMDSLQSDTQEKSASADARADIQWRLKPGGNDWKELRDLPNPLSLKAARSGTIGKVKGWGTNANHKYWVWLGDPESEILIRISFQNNIKNIKGRPIPFGNITPRKLFEDGGAQREEMVDVQFGIGTFIGLEFQEFAWMQSVPRGTLLIHDFTVGKDGSLDSLKAQLEFDLPEWNTVHPKGHAVVDVDAQLKNVRFRDCEGELTKEPRKPRGQRQLL